MYFDEKGCKAWGRQLDVRNHTELFDELRWRSGVDDEAIGRYAYEGRMAAAAASAADGSPTGQSQSPAKGKGKDKRAMTITMATPRTSCASGARSCGSPARPSAPLTRHPFHN